MNYSKFKRSLNSTPLIQKDEICEVVSLREDIYNLIPKSTILEIIGRNHNSEKITNTLIENIIQKAKNQELTTETSVKEIRQLNAADNVFESHVEYKLNDGKVVVISEEMDRRLNKILGQHKNILLHMQESAENFMDVINDLEE